MFEENSAIGLVAEICRSRQIAALDDFIESCRGFAGDEILNVAVFGRFKAGKSSFLNHLLGRQLLPVGAIPVTAVVTEIEYGPRDRAEVVFQDGRAEGISPECIGSFISEAENPANVKQVVRVRLELGSMAPYRSIRFVDTPGLESVFEHNTEASLDWLPNVGLALVAVGVDPPLSQHDVELIRRLGRYTPNISLLLTKIDLLEDGERREVEDFVRRELARYGDREIAVFPYSIRPGFEHLRERLDRELLSGARADAGEHRAAILRHKLDSLADECAAYLNLALKAAERDESERERLLQSILGEKQYLEETRQTLRLIARHAAGASRAAFERILENDELPVRGRLVAELAEEFPAWTRSLSAATERFDGWLGGAIAREMAGLSQAHRGEFIEPIGRVSRQLSQALQDFRNRLSERALSALGVPLRTSEMELHVAEPQSPDVRVGKIFDRGWELLSFLMPMWAIQGILKRHFTHKVADVVFMNLSRLATQWAEAVNGSIAVLEKEAIRRVDGLVATIERLIASAERETPRIRADLQRLEGLARRIGDDADPHRRHP
jgi:GTP-binding protein EngB required for normal cell division